MPNPSALVTTVHDCYIGLMSGTSLDGADGVLARFDASGRIQILGYANQPFPTTLRTELMALNSPHGSNELHRAALAGNAISRIYAQVVHMLLEASGLPATAICAMGAHGQTVRHQPQLHDGIGYTLQLQNPALLAELTGISVIADLRSRDVAAGGQGAPLVPAFHQSMFAQPQHTTAILNIGGIANLSILPAQENTAEPIIGFDCGPGNALMDWWCLQHTGQPYDQDGRWAASGQLIPKLMQQLLSAPYLQLPPPKSTGRDLFNPAWLQQQLATLPKGTAPEDVQATLTAFTAQACADALLRHGQEVATLQVCGGGALNHELLRQLQKRLPHVLIQTTAASGMPVMQVEAAAFAWLARQCLMQLAGNLPAVTGARGPRILGAIYPA